MVDQDRGGDGVVFRPYLLYQTNGDGAQGDAPDCSGIDDDLQGMLHHTHHASGLYPIRNKNASR